MDNNNRALNNPSPQPNFLSGGQASATPLYRGGVPPQQSIHQHQQYQSPSTSYQYGPASSSIHSQPVQLGHASQHRMQFPPENMPWSVGNSPSSSGGGQQLPYGAASSSYSQHQQTVTGYQQQHTVHHRGPPPSNMYSSSLQRLPRHNMQPQQTGYVSQPPPGVLQPEEAGYASVPPPPPPYYMSASPASLATQQQSSYSTFQPGNTGLAPTHARPQHFIQSPGGGPSVQPQSSQVYAGFLHQTSPVGASSSSVPFAGGNDASVNLYSSSNMMPLNNNNNNQPHFIYGGGPPPLSTLPSFPPRFSASNASIYGELPQATVGTPEPGNFVSADLPQQVAIPAAAAVDYFAYLSDIRSSSSTTSRARSTENPDAVNDSDEDHAPNTNEPTENNSKSSSGEAVISLADLLDVALQTIYADFTQLMGLMPSLELHSVDRKASLISYCWRSRNYMVRFYAAYEWSVSSMTKVLKCGRLIKYCCDVNDAYLETADFFAHLARETLALTKLSCYQVRVATEVLCTGAYKRLPSCLQSEIIENNKTPFDWNAEKPNKFAFSSSFVEQQLVRSLSSRLIQRNVFPDHMRLQPVALSHNGVATVAVDGEFQLGVTIDSTENDSACWRIVSLSFLLPDFGISGGSGALTLIEDKKLHTLRSIGCMVPKQVRFLREVLQESLDSGQKSSLTVVYDVLHDICANLKLEILLTQLLQLEQTMTLNPNDFLGADFDAEIEAVNIFTVLSYEPGHSATIAYWHVSSNVIFHSFDDDFVCSSDEFDQTADESDPEICYTVKFSYQKPVCGQKPWRIEHFPSFLSERSTYNATAVQFFDVVLDANLFIPNLLRTRCLEKLELLHFTLFPWLACVRLHFDSSECVPYVGITLLTSYYTNPTATSPHTAPTRTIRIFVHQYTGMYYVSRHHLPTMMHQFPSELKQKTLDLLKKLEDQLNRASSYEVLQQNFVSRSSCLHTGTDHIVEILFDIEKNLLKGFLIVYCQSLGLSYFLPDVDKSRASVVTPSNLLLFGRETAENRPVPNETLFFRLLECEDYIVALNVMLKSHHTETHVELAQIARLGKSLSSNDAEHLRQSLQPSMTAASLPRYNTHVHDAGEIARLAPFSILATVGVLDQSMSNELRSNDFYAQQQNSIVRRLPFLDGLVSATISIPPCSGCSTFSVTFLTRLEQLEHQRRSVDQRSSGKNDAVPSTLNYHGPKTRAFSLVTRKDLTESFMNSKRKLPSHQLVPWSKLPRAVPDFKLQKRSNEAADAAELMKLRSAVDLQLRNFSKTENLCISQNLYETGTVEATDAPVSHTGDLGTELSHVLSSCVEHLPFFEVQKALVGRGFTLAQPFAADGRGGGGMALTGRRGIHTVEIVRFPPPEDAGEVQFHGVFAGAVLTYVPRTTRILDPIPIGVFLVTLRFCDVLYTTTASAKRGKHVSNTQDRMEHRKLLSKPDNSQAEGNKTDYEGPHGRNTLKVLLNYQASQTNAEVCARVAEDMESDFRALAKIYGFLHAWWRYDMALRGKNNGISDPLIRSILSTVEVKQYDVANLSFCYRMAPLFTPPSMSAETPRVVTSRAAEREQKTGPDEDHFIAADDNAVISEIAGNKSIPSDAERNDADDEQIRPRSAKKRVSLANLFIDFRPSPDQSLSPLLFNSTEFLPAEYEMHLSWDSRQRVFNVGLRCAAAHGVGTNPHLVIRDLLSQQLESLCSMKQDRERVWSSRQYCHVVDMLYNLSVTIRPITLLGALACRSPLIQYDPRIDFAYTVEAGQTPAGATNPTRGWYNHSPYRMRPLKPNVYRLEMCKRMRLLFVVDQYGQVLVGDEGLPIYCAYKRRRLIRAGGRRKSSIDEALNKKNNLMLSLLDDDDEATASNVENVPSRFSTAESSSTTSNSLQLQYGEIAGPGPPPISSSSSSVPTDTSLRSLLMRPVTSSSNLAQYGAGPPSSAAVPPQSQLPAAASARPSLPPVVLPNPASTQQQQQQQPVVTTVPRTKFTLPLGLHFQLMRPTIYLFEFFGAWQQRLRRLTQPESSENTAEKAKEENEAALGTTTTSYKSSPSRQQIFRALKSRPNNRAFLRVSKKLDLYELETALFCFLFTPLSTLKRQLVDNLFVERTLPDILHSLDAFSSVSLFEQFMTSCYVLQMLPIWLRDEISEGCQLVRPSSAQPTPANSATLHQVVLINAYSRFCVRFSVKSLYTELNFLAADRVGELSLAVSDRGDAAENAENDERFVFMPTNLLSAVEVEMLDALFRRRICITPFNVMKMASWFKLLSSGEGPLLLREILHVYFHQFGDQWLSKPKNSSTANAKNSTDENDVLDEYQQLNTFRRPREQWRWTVELCFHQPIDEFPVQLKLLEPPVILLPTQSMTTGLPVHRVLLFFRFQSKSIDSGDAEIPGENIAADVSTVRGNAAPPPPTADVPALSTSSAVETASEKTGKGAKKESAKKRKKRLTEAAASSAAPAAGASAVPLSAAESNTDTTSSSTAETSDSTPAATVTAAQRAPTDFGKPRVFYLPVRYETIGETNSRGGSGDAASANVVVEITDEQIARQPLLLRVRQAFASFTQTYNTNFTASDEVASGAPAGFKLVYLLDAVARNPLI